MARTRFRESRFRRGEAAVPALRRAVQLQPDMGDAWRALGDHLTAMGDTAGADAAYAQHIRASTRDPRLLEPALALCEGRIAVAEALLREHLKQSSDRRRRRSACWPKWPRASAATPMPRTCCARCLELAPGFTRGAPQLRAGAAPAEQAGRGAARRSSSCCAAEPRNPELSQPEGRRARAHRRVRAGDRALRGSARASTRTSRRSG